MRESIKKKINMMILLIGVFAIAAGCSAAQKGSSAGYGVFYLTQDDSQILLENTPELTAVSGMSDYILALQNEPKDMKLKRTLGSEIKLIDYRKEENGAILNFEEKYNDMPIEKEVLFRAAIAQTLLQDKDINYVSFEVNGEPLKYGNGEEVGSMTYNTFIDNAGDELSSYIRKTIRLYFASDDRNSLIETERDVIYSSNESLEKITMEQLIEGPRENEGYPTISPDVKINTISVKNGVCYVGLDTALVDKPVDVTEETLLYSIVNTLTSLPGVNRVQISVNGETDRALRSNLRLDEAYSFNEEIVSSD